jgi:hypothetical protein
MLANKGVFVEWTESGWYYLNEYSRSTQMLFPIIKAICKHFAVKSAQRLVSHWVKIVYGSPNSRTYSLEANFLFSVTPHRFTRDDHGRRILVLTKY